MFGPGPGPGCSTFQSANRKVPSPMSPGMARNVVELMPVKRLSNGGPWPAVAFWKVVGSTNCPSAPKKAPLPTPVALLSRSMASPFWSPITFAAPGRPIVLSWASVRRMPVPPPTATSPVTSVPILLPAMMLPCAPKPTERPVMSLSEMTLPAPGSAPPMVLSEEERSIPVWFNRLKVPVASVPMKLPWTRLSLDCGSR